MVGSFMDDPTPSHQSITSLDLRSTRFIIAPSVDLNPMLRRWSETRGFTTPAVINEFRKEHYARRLASGGYLVPGYRTKIVQATRRGIVVDTYQAGIWEYSINLCDSSGTRIGTAEWGGISREVKFADMTVNFLPSFKPEFIHDCKFKFCSWVPIQVELTSVPCLEFGTRIAMLEEGIYTFELVDAQGKYYWRQDNSNLLMDDWPPGRTPRLATRFSYPVGVKLVVLQGNSWMTATVCGVVNAQHQVQLEEAGEKVTLDLNEFNHTWRETLVDESGGYDVCMETYKTAMEEENRMIEDAITGKKLRAADQLLAIHIRKAPEANMKGKNEQEEDDNDLEPDDDDQDDDVALELKDSDRFNITDIKNVHGLVHILLRECRREAQERHFGRYRVPAFIIVAAPGSGKTWTMRQLVYLISRAPTPAGTIAQVPFVMFVQVLASLIRKHDPLHRECDLNFVEFYIRHTMTRPAQRQFLLQAFRMRTVIVIVDGIDEASDLREVIVRLILRQLYDQGHTVVATSRPEGVQQPDGSLLNPELGEYFTILDLKRLTKRQQKRAIKEQLIGNRTEFFDNLDGYSEVRLRYDNLYATFTSQWEVEKQVSIDRTKGADGKLKFGLRQRGIDGTKLNTREIGATLLSKTLQSPSDRLEELLEKLKKQQKEQKKPKEKTDKQQQYQQQHQPMPHRRHPGKSQQPLTQSSLWALIIAATDEMYSIAEKVHPKLEAEMRTLLCIDANIEGKLVFAPLKDPVRVFEKALDDYWNRYSDNVPATACVTDIIRCSVVCPNLESVAEVARVLIHRLPQWLVLLRAKNKFREPDSAHFRNILFNFRVLCCAGCGALENSMLNPCECEKPLPTSHLFEIQVHHEKILELSKTLRDHEYYEFFRSKNQIIKGDDLDFMLDKQMQFFAEIRSSPVLLSLLILILDQGDFRLPNSVYQLYEMAIDASITRFVEEQRPQLDDVETGRLKSEVLRLMQKIGHRNHIERKPAFEHLPPTDPDYELWNEICATGVNDTTGLAFVRVIAQLELYKFTHLSFQEYLFWKEALDKQQSLNFHAMVKDVWNYNALRIGVSNPTLNSALIPAHEPFVWRNISKRNVDLCYQILRANKGAKEISLVESKHLVAIPRINDQVECLLMNRNRMTFRSPLESGLVDCKLKTLGLVASVSSGLEHVVEALRGNVFLNCLHLAGNKVADAAIPASLFASNPSLLAMTLSLDSLSMSHNILKYVRALQRPTGQTVLVMSKNIVPSRLFDAEVSLQMWGFNDAQVTSAQNQINGVLAEYVEALPLSCDLMCVAPVGPSDDGPITFVSLVFGDFNFAMICLSSRTTHLDLRGLVFGVKSLPQLMLYVRNFKTLKLKLADRSALECLISLLITHSSARKLDIHVVFSSTAYHGLFGFEDYRLMQAARLWGVTITDEKKDEEVHIHLFPLLALFACVSIWTSIAGHAVYGNYECLMDKGGSSDPTRQSLMGSFPYNLWNLLTFSWIVWMAGLLDLDFDITSQITILCSYVFCVLVVLTHNLIKPTEVVPPERKSLSASVFTHFEMSSYLVHLFTVGQLLSLGCLPNNHHDFEPQLSAFMMLDVFDHVGTLWLWGTIAAVAVAMGVIPLLQPGENVMVFTLPEGFYLGCGIFEIPIMFHLLGHCFRTIFDPEWRSAHASVVLCILALFMLANSTVWMYFKRAYSGRNVLNAGEWYMKLDLMLKFVVIFLSYLLADRPQVFRGIAAVIFLAEFSIVLMIQPCEQKRGNYFHMGSLAILVLSSVYALLKSFEVVPSDSLVPLITLGGAIALIFLLTFLMIVRVKNFPSVHMLNAVGRANVEPLPEPKFRFDDETLPGFALWSILIEMVVTPLIANVVREWNVDDVCLPLQIWSVVVVVTAGIGLRVFVAIYSDMAEKILRAMLSVFVFAWFIAGCVLLSDGACGGEIFAFSVYVMVMVSIPTLILCVFWLSQLLDNCF